MKLSEVNDIFENDELVVMKVTFEVSGQKIVNTDIGIKDSTGDIIRIVTVSSRITE